jgi:ABC-type tungstate transport system permease subunit
MKLPTVFDSRERKVDFVSRGDASVTASDPIAKQMSLKQSMRVIQKF